MATLMKSLDASTRLHVGFSRETSYFDTHPAAQERAADAATAAEVRKWKAKFAIARTRTQYLERMQGLALGTPASEGVVEDGRFMHPDLGIALRFPNGWRIENTQAAVIGISPTRGAVLMLELAGEGDDAEAAATAFLEEANARADDSGPLQIGEFDAYRIAGSLPTVAGRQQALMAFIAHDGLIYRLSGFALRGRYSHYEGVFRSFPRRFRLLTEADRDSIEELRMDIAEARAGETLADLAARTGNTWTITETAVYNGLRPDAVLDAGQAVKVAVSRPYRPHAGASDDDPPDADPEARRQDE